MFGIALPIFAGLVIPFESVAKHRRDAHLSELSFQIVCTRVWLHVGLIIMSVFLYVYGSGPFVSSMHEKGAIHTFGELLAFAWISLIVSAFIVFVSSAFFPIWLWRTSQMIVGLCGIEILIFLAYAHLLDLFGLS